MTVGLTNKKIVCEFLDRVKAGGKDISASSKRIAAACGVASLGGLLKEMERDGLIGKYRMITGTEYFAKDTWRVVLECMAERLKVS